MKTPKLKEYIQNQIAQSEERLKGYTRDITGNKFKPRNVYVLLRGYVKNFLKSGENPRMVIMPGLRGVEKTTLNEPALFYSSLSN